MLTQELLNAMTPGMALELGALFPGLSDEPVVALVDKIKPKGEGVHMAQLSLHYHNVLLGTYIVHKSGDDKVALLAGVLA